MYAVVLGCACAGESNDEICRDRGQQIGAMIDQADTRCASDAECAVFISPTSCFRGCGVAIRADAVDALTKQLELANAEICSADGIQCTVPLVPCPLLHAACDGGICKITL
jgi:hypothetical protein